jgi:hypothetical protein
MALALLAAWRASRRWGVQWLTLAAGALLMSLPVLSGTQPGEVFNDVVGLAALMVAVALSWSRLDPNLTPILHPAADDWVFRIAPGPGSPEC